MLFDAVVTVTYEGQVRARSRDDAEGAVIADSGHRLTHQTDVFVDLTLLVPSSTGGKEEDKP